MRLGWVMTMATTIWGMAAAQQAPAPAAPGTHKWALVLHGGAGVIERSSMKPETEKQYRAGLEAALRAAAAVLDKGGSSVDAVEAGIRLLEDNPMFNAGKGAVFTADGKNELDAAVMNGATLEAGSVAGVTRTRNPISLARAVMEKSGHVMLIDGGADAFGASVGLQQEPPSYFFTERRWQSLVKQLTKEGNPSRPGQRASRLRRLSPLPKSRRRRRTSTARWVSWRLIARATSRQARPPAVSRANGGIGWATRR